VVEVTATQRDIHIAHCLTHFSTTVLSWTLFLYLSLTPTKRYGTHAKPQQTQILRASSYPSFLHQFTCFSFSIFWSILFFPFTSSSYYSVTVYFLFLVATLYLSQTITSCKKIVYKLRKQILCIHPIIEI